MKALVTASDIACTRTSSIVVVDGDEEEEKLMAYQNWRTMKKVSGRSDTESAELLWRILLP